MVLDVLEQLAENPRREREPALPDLGAILSLVRDRTHPLAHLRGIVRKLARNFGTVADEELLECFQDACGHRTDKDIDKAYKEILWTGTDLKRMPTAGQFREACGEPRIYRDGSRPDDE